MDYDFDAVAERCGWSPSTQVSVLLEYIERQQSNQAFEDYLAVREADEADDPAEERE